MKNKNFVINDKRQRVHQYNCIIRCEWESRNI